MMSRIMFIFVAIFMLGISDCSRADNSAPPVPRDTNVGNGHSMQTDVRIDVNDGTDKVVVKHTTEHDKLITRAFELKFGYPTVIRGIFRQCLQGTKDQAFIPYVRVETMSYDSDDITGVLIVTASADRFEEADDGSMSIPELIKILDQPLMQQVEMNRHFIGYEAKYRSAHELKEMLENIVLDVNPQTALFTADSTDIEAAGGAAKYYTMKEKLGEVETKYGREFIFIDEELNQLFIACSPVHAKKVLDFLKLQDQPYQNLHVNIDVYELNNRNEIGVGNDFNAWKDANATSLFNYADGGKTVSLKLEVDAKYVTFLARKGKASLYSSMGMVLESGDSSSFDLRKILIKILKKKDSIDDQEARVEGVATDPSSGDLYYGTMLNITPYNQGRYSKLKLDIENISLIGFNDDGTAQTTTSTLDTEVVLDNKGTKIIAGYFSRKEVVQTVSKVPFFGSIPLLGFMFSSENNHTRTIQQVVVVSCVGREYNDSPVDVGFQDVDKILKTVKGSKTEPKMGFDQFKSKE